MGTCASASTSASASVAPFPPPPRVAISACLCGGGALARAIWAQPYILKVAWRAFRRET